MFMKSYVLVHIKHIQCTMKNESANVIKHIFSYNLDKTVKLEICKKYISHLKRNRCVLIKNNI